MMNLEMLLKEDLGLILIILDQMDGVEQVKQHVSWRDLLKMTDHGCISIWQVQVFSWKMINLDMEPNFFLNLSITLKLMKR